MADVDVVAGDAPVLNPAGIGFRHLFQGDAGGLDQDVVDRDLHALGGLVVDLLPERQQRKYA